MTVLRAAAATRDGDRLLLQNDIDTNDAHVLVLQVNACKITLTYPEDKTLKGILCTLIPIEHLVGRFVRG